MRRRSKYISLAIALVLILSITAAYMLTPAATGSGGVQSLDDDDDDDVSENSGVTDPNDPAEPTPDVDGNTTLMVCKEASGFWEQCIEYDWCLEKTIIETDDVMVDESGHLGWAEVPPGETVTIEYLLDVDREAVVESERMGVRGFVTVCNTGDYPTENLEIVDHIQMTSECDGWVDVFVFGIDTSCHPVLAPGEEFTYHYEFEFEGVPGAEYCNMACVSITNFDGHDGDVFGVPAFAGFFMPMEPMVETIDETATLEDHVYCPENFECVPSMHGPFMLDGPEEIVVCVEVTNCDADCEQSRCLWNHAQLWEDDTCEYHESCAYVNLLTGPCQCFTTITVEKYAELKLQQRIEYNWTVEKSFEVQNDQVRLLQQADIFLPQGEKAEICYTITADREVVFEELRAVLEGAIRVCNTGECPTEGLEVHDVFVVIFNEEEFEFEFDVSTEDMPVLGPGDCYEYEYEVDVTEFLESIMEESFRNEVEPELVNVGMAGITNFEGFEGFHYVWDEVEVYIGEPEVEVIDETATLTDLETFPDGFEMDIVAGPWYLEGPDTIRFCKNITNVDAECMTLYYVNDTARLVEDDTGQVREDDASVIVETPECEECDGCTRTIGFWKNHDGSGPQSDEITPLIELAGGTIWLGTPNGAESVAVTTAAEARAILDQDEASNGINKLYAQMLGAKLNVLSGACDDAIEEAIAEADAFLAIHSSADWDSLTEEEQQQVLDWKDIFDDYNNGLIGPGHCDD